MLAGARPWDPSQAQSNKYSESWWLNTDSVLGSRSPTFPVEVRPRLDDHTFQTTAGNTERPCLENILRVKKIIQDAGPVEGF